MNGATRPYLADACAIIVFFAARPMSQRMLSIMSGPDVFVSPVTVWEITRKAGQGFLLPAWRGGGFANLLDTQGFSPFPLSWEDAEHANLLPPLHKDPMDRMPIAQALRNDMTVITSDRIFSAYGVRTIW